MEFGQFVIMFKALFLEGFARPFEGVRVVLRVLLEKYRSAGGERRMKCGVQRIVARNGRAAALILDDGTEITAEHVISSIGAPETEALLETPRAPDTRSKPTGDNPHASKSGRLSFVETITVLNRQPAEI